MKFSMVSLAAVMTAAVLFVCRFGLFISILIAAAFIIVFIIKSCISRKVDSAVLIFTAGFIAAAVSCAAATGSIAHPLSEQSGRFARLNGIVISNPEESRTSDNIKYTVRVRSIEKDGRTEKISDTILLTAKERLSCGDTVTFSGIVSPIPEQMNENGFNTALYYRSQNIYSRVYSEDIVCTGTGFYASPSFISQKFRGAVDNMIYKYLSGDEAALVSAALTGNTHRFSDDFNAILTKTAFKRLLHPAYLHIWLIVTLVGIVCGFLKKGYRDTVTVLALCAYAVLSCSNIGFIRCIIMAALTIISRKHSGDTYYPDTLAEIFIVTTLVMPMLIFNVTFIISSAAGLLIWAFTPFITKRLRIVPFFIRRMTAIMIICALFLTPISLIFFSGVCVYSFLTPFIMMPVVLMMLIFAPVVFTMLTFFGTAPVFGSYFMLLVKLVIRLPYIIEALPFSYIVIGTPSPSGYILIIGSICMIYYCFRNNRRRFLLSGAVSCGMFLSIIISSLARIGTTDFMFVNVGQGDGSVIHTAYGTTVIIDGGGGSSYSEFNPGESIFVPYLESKGFYNIDAAFVSHFHKDHVQGVLAAIEHLHVKTLFCSAPRSGDTEEAEWYYKFTAAAEANGTEIRNITENTRISFDCGLEFDVYAPDDELINAGGNDASLLIKASCGGAEIIYTGDMTAKAERSALSRGADVDADVLKVGHHGSAGSTTAEWVDAVSPDFAVISCGEDNTYGHPAEQTLERLKYIRTLRTDMDGDIKITADKNKIRQVSVFK